MNSAKPLFQLGTIHATTRAYQALVAADLNLRDLLQRHITGDWGDTSIIGKRINSAAIALEQPIVSRYLVGEGEVLVVTEGNRSETTLLLSDEARMACL